MARMTLKVRGMYCPSCERILEMEIVGLPGVDAVSADYRSKTVGIEGHDVDSSIVERVIRENGYKI